uniref:Uncharacterized protein n=1 Tax=Rhizophora mucronata TaxID=61149 RepID=A0A2P2NY00_RHIMU
MVITWGTCKSYKYHYLTLVLKKSCHQHYLCICQLCLL